MIYNTRRQAGVALAHRLAKYSRRPDVIVLGLPRGGVPVAYEVAERLDVPLDVFVIRKLALPDDPEIALGAVTTGGIRVLNPEVIESMRIPPQTIERVAAGQERELSRQERLYRGDQRPLQAANRCVILVDDGMATGSTMQAAIHALREQGAKTLVAGVPVAPREACEVLAPQLDEIVCLNTPDPFFAVSLWYEDFDQTSDGDVRRLLEQAQNRVRIGEHSRRH
ncbi:MAG TPA: phosphoribosyltransferase [Candidatus Eisenbacteria bacterium]|nr:phosphoribosyltransferase [Candidatus Eisenbacteria bacterium]